MSAVRRKYTEEEKLQIVSEIKAGASINSVATKNNISTSTIHNWLTRDNKSVIKKKKNNKELKLIQNKYDDAILENKILKELLKKTYQIWDTGSQ